MKAGMIPISMCLIALLLVASDSSSQTLLKLADQRTIYGNLEMSVGTSTPILVMTIDLPDAQGRYDGNVEGVYVLELEPGVPKPSAFKREGKITYKAHESLSIELKDKTLVFSRLVPASTDPGSAKKIVDLIEARRSRLADRPILHAELAALYLPMEHGPFVKKPK